jgi:hypothetical protein
MQKNEQEYRPEEFLWIEAVFWLLNICTNGQSMIDGMNFEEEAGG